ncbi:MAG: DNA-binding protein [Planctomycetaceae bacterium]|nr:DNA-binding protein [Planctomycetaceae bacterium]
MPLENPLLTVATVSTRIGLSAHAVLSLIAAGALPASNVGSGTMRPRWRIDPADLAAWLASRRAGPVSRSVRRRRSMAIPEYV